MEGGRRNLIDAACVWRLCGVPTPVAGGGEGGGGEGGGEGGGGEGGGEGGVGGGVVRHVSSTAGSSDPVLRVQNSLPETYVSVSAERVASV